ncbi:hypothetical protein KSP40_PGU014483 [Platanthera guangdongensis]|uniref:RNase H type-1 domain-containing protein n=1 Tax=Platanthera guangdongensis TaxID=2320717 RepID=A0ABR2MRT4_9ASPA
MVEGDSVIACSTLNRILAGVYHGVVESKWAGLMMECPRLVISQIDRRANSAANFVANQACLSDFVWERGMSLLLALSFILSKDSEPIYLVLFIYIYECPTWGSASMVMGDSTRPTTMSFARPIKAGFARNIYV